MVNPRITIARQGTGLTECRASMPSLTLEGKRSARIGLKDDRRIVLGGSLSRVTWQDGFPPDNPNMVVLYRVTMLGLSTRWQYAQSTAIESP